MGGEPVDDAIAHAPTSVEDRLLHFDVHRSPLAELVPRWEELFTADPRATPFASPGWARAWWRHFSGDAEPWLLTATDGGRLVGLAPLVIHRRGPFRIVRGLGKEPGDYWDMLAVPSARDAVAHGFARELARRRGEWDLLELERMPPWSPLPSAVLRAGLLCRRSAPTPCPTIELPRSFDQYLAALPQARRTNFRRRLRHLDEGKLELREIDDPAELAGAVDRWHAIRIRQWREQGRQLAPLHATQRFRDFTADLLELLVPAGLGLVWELWRDGELAGSYVNFVDRNSFYQYLGGFEPRLARMGIGKLATCHGIRTSIAAGRRTYDFMVGDEPYKYDYGATTRYATSLLLGSGRPRSRSALAGRRLKRAL